MNDELIPMTCIELQSVIYRSSLINKRAKKTISDELVRQFMLYIIDLYKEELKLTFDELNN